MCIRDRLNENVRGKDVFVLQPTCAPTNDNLMELIVMIDACLLYTSDAADERSSVDLGGRRIIKKKQDIESEGRRDTSINTGQ